MWAQRTVYALLYEEDGQLLREQQGNGVVIKRLGRVATPCHQGTRRGRGIGEPTSALLPFSPPSD